MFCVLTVFFSWPWKCGKATSRSTHSYCPSDIYYKSLSNRNCTCLKTRQLLYSHASSSVRLCLSVVLRCSELNTHDSEDAIVRESVTKGFDDHKVNNRNAQLPLKLMHQLCVLAFTWLADAVPCWTTLCCVAANVKQVLCRLPEHHALAPSLCQSTGFI